MPLDRRRPELPGEITRGENESLLHALSLQYVSLHLRMGCRARVQAAVNRRSLSAISTRPGYRNDSDRPS